MTMLPIKNYYFSVLHFVLMLFHNLRLAARTNISNNIKLPMTCYTTNEIPKCYTTHEIPK